MQCAALSFCVPFTPMSTIVSRCSDTMVTFLPLGVHAHEHHAVGAEVVAFVLRRRGAFLRPVGAHEQHVERIARILRVHQRGFQFLGDAFVHVGVDGLQVGECGAHSAQNQHQNDSKGDERDGFALALLALPRVVGLRHPAGIGVGRMLPISPERGGTRAIRCSPSASIGV